VSNSLDRDETPSYSASQPDPSCLHSYGTLVVSSGQRVILGEGLWSDKVHNDSDACCVCCHSVVTSCHAATFMSVYFKYSPFFADMGKGAGSFQEGKIS